MNDFKRNDRFSGRRAGGGFGRPQGQMHKAMCGQCRKTCEVPFRPDGQRPIYCRECFRGNPAPEPSRGFQKPALRSVVATPSAAPALDPRIGDIQGSLAKIQLKIDQILLALVVAKAQNGAEAEIVKKKKSSKKRE